jgi:hypothetical protein
MRDMSSVVCPRVSSAHDCRGCRAGFVRLHAETGPVAVVAPAADLDTLAYGRPGYGPAAVPVAYAPPVSTYDAQYKLDAGDKLRVVVYGQEGLTNSYAIDAGGAITMPLIGRVPARGMTPAGWLRASPAACAMASFASRRWLSKSKPTVRSSSSVKLPLPASIPTCPI